MRESGTGFDHDRRFENFREVLDHRLGHHFFHHRFWRGHQDNWAGDHNRTGNDHRTRHDNICGRERERRGCQDQGHQSLLFHLFSHLRSPNGSAEKTFQSFFWWWSKARSHGRRKPSLSSAKEALCVAEKGGLLTDRGDAGGGKPRFTGIHRLDLFPSRGHPFT